MARRVRPGKARIAVIGTGWWATFAHIPAIQHNPQAELVALADIRPEALDKAQAAYGPVKGYTDYRALLKHETLDGVVIAVHHAAHYPIAKRCLEAGLHVLLEKPMTLKAAHAHHLHTLAQRHQRELIIGYPFHYSAATQHARRWLQSGWLGPIQYLHCSFASQVIEFYRGNDQAYGHWPVTGPGRVYADPKRSGGGQGHLQVTHSAALMFYVTGLAPERVTAFMDNWDVPVDLVNAIAIRFQPVAGHPALGLLGSTGNISPSGQTELNLLVYCEQGLLKLDQSTGTVYARHHNGQERNFGPLTPDEVYPRAAPVDNLVGVIMSGASNGSPASVGVITVELLEAAYRSAARQGRPIQIPPYEF